MSSRRYHHGDLKSALIESGRKLLKNKGIEALSLRTLASDVGVSHMAPYAHFKNKSELFQAIAADGFNELAMRQEEVDVSLPANLLILEYGVQYIEFAIANAPLYRLMLSQTQILGPDTGESDQHLSQELRDASKRPFVLLRNAFSRLFDDKDVQNIRAQGAWSLVHGMSALMIDGHLVIPPGMSLKQYLGNASLQLPG